MVLICKVLILLIEKHKENPRSMNEDYNVVPRVGLEPTRLFTGGF